MEGPSWALLLSQESLTANLKIFRLGILLTIQFVILIRRLAEKNLYTFQVLAGFFASEMPTCTGITAG